MLKEFKNGQAKAFLDNKEGAVTVDFVVLTAAVVLIAAAAATAVDTKVSTAITSLSL